MRNFGVLVLLFVGCASPDKLTPDKVHPKNDGPTCGHGALDNDPKNCGECGHDCTQLPGVDASVKCVQGVCDVGHACVAGRAHCSKNPDDGCEADLSSPKSCGSCGNVCSGATATCNAGTCAGGCDGGASECGGACVDVATDAKNCGACGQACPVPANGAATCSAGKCGLTCDSGFTNMMGACVAPAGAGWTPQTSNTTETLYGIWGVAGGDRYITGNHGTVLHATGGGAWSAVPSSAKIQLMAVWGADANTVLSVGWNINDQGGAVFRPGSDGSWSGNGFLPSMLTGIWGSAADDLYAVGENGTILYSRSGTRWTVEPSPTTSSLWGVWGSDIGNLWAVGDRGTIARSDGAGDWIRERSGATGGLMAVWGTSASDLYVVGRNGVILHSSGDGSWSAQKSGVTTDLFTVFGASATEIYAAGSGGVILESAGDGTWTAATSGTTRTLWSLWGSKTDGLFAVGDAGTILHK